MLGVGTLIVVMAVMNGFRHELIDKILGVNAHIQIVRNDGTAFNPDEIILSNGAIISASPVDEGHAMVSTAKYAGGALVRGVSGVEMARRGLLANAIKQGISWKNFNESDGVIIGQRMADEFGLQLGDTITLTSPVMARTAFGSMPRAKGYEIVGLFDVGMYEYDKSVVFMNLTEAGKFFALNDGQAMRFEVMLDNPNQAQLVMNDLLAQLPPHFRLYNWQNNNSSLMAALIVERNVMFIILTMIILVAAFNIITGQIMLVRDKQSNIAILRANGASRARIARVFLMMGSFLGLSGTLLGVAGGVAFASNIENIRQFVQYIIGRELFSAEIYYLTKMPAKLEMTSVVAVVVMALVITLLSAIIPAIRAANTDPIRALRHE